MHCTRLLAHKGTVAAQLRRAFGLQAMPGQSSCGTGFVKRWRRTRMSSLTEPTRGRLALQAGHRFQRQPQLLPSSDDAGQSLSQTPDHIRGSSVSHSSAAAAQRASPPPSHVHSHHSRAHPRWPQSEFFAPAWPDRRWEERALAWTEAAHGSPCRPPVPARVVSRVRKQHRCTAKSLHWPARPLRSVAQCFH
jgi:hypothetical protein